MWTFNIVKILSPPPKWLYKFNEIPSFSSQVEIHGTLETNLAVSSKDAHIMKLRILTSRVCSKEKSHPYAQKAMYKNDHYTILLKTPINI